MIKRLILKTILDQRNSPKVSIVIGPRQVGKTTLLKEIHRQLGGLFFDVEIFSSYDQISTYERMIYTLKTNGYQESQPDFFYVFLDEFQHYPDLSRVIKSVYDHHKNIKIFATGSSSLEIKNSIQESLAGRKIVTHMYPLDFEEFLLFKNKNEILEKIKNLPEDKTDDYFSAIPEARGLLGEFLVFGGYPDVVLAKTEEEKIEAFKSIFDLYIKKDFAEYAKAEKIRSAKLLMTILAINNGQAANYAKYTAESELSIETVKNYLSILEETFMVLILRPYFTNKNKEISKMPKVYFLDNGVRNFFSGGFAPIEKRADAGFLFKGFYISRLIKKGYDQSSLKYYRTKSGEEIDVIIDKHPALVPIEIKFKKNISPRDVSAVRRFMQKNSLSAGYVVSAGAVGKSEGVEIANCFKDIL